MAILITGAAGYIGSHCMRIMTERGIAAVGLDSLVKGHRGAVNGAKLYVGSTGDADILRRIFSENEIDGIVHFAAYSIVPESIANPGDYYRNNVCSTLTLLEEMVSAGVKTIVFSSTAATYGIPDICPITEDAPQLPINPYGDTKLAIERMLHWFGVAHGIKSVCLRYFNVAGAHQSGDIGEAHSPETHLIPLVLFVANGKRDNISIYGNDYDTKDGTNIRDYIHVQDLIEAHILALRYLSKGGDSNVFNLGSGGGYSNLEILEAAREVTGHPIPMQFAPRRGGDPDTLIASSEKAERVLGWKRKYTDIKDIIASAWKWHSGHPEGF